VRVQDLGQTHGAAICDSCPSSERCLTPSFFEHLNDQRSLDLRISTYPTGTWVVRQQVPLAGIHIVCEGSVAISAERADQRETVLSVAGPDTVINLEDWVLARPIYSFSARTLTRSSIIFVGKDDLRRLYAEDHEISQLMTAHLARRMEATLQRHIARLTTDVKSRLVIAFRDLLEATGQHVAQDAEFAFPINRQLLADIVGAAPESISRAMTEIETDALIIRNPSRISIPDVPRLLQYAAKATNQAAPDPSSWLQPRTKP